MTRPWIVLGGGGHASVIIDALHLLGQRILGFTDPAEAPRRILGIERLGGDDVIDAYAPARVILANGLGSIGSTQARTDLYRRFAIRGYTFSPVVHPSAVVAQSADLGAGTQIMAGAVVQANCRLGENVIINTRASVDHDCAVGANVHVAPGVTISGGVRVGEGCHISAGASVVQGVSIGAGSVIGAGAVVLRDVASGVTVVGVPGRVKGRAR